LVKLGPVTFFSISVDLKYVFYSPIEKRYQISPLAELRQESDPYADLGLSQATTKVCLFDKRTYRNAELNLNAN